MPPAAITRFAPALIERIALTTASKPDAQTLLTVSAVTVLARPDLKTHLTRRILPDAGLQHFAERDVLDLGRIDLGALERRGQRDGAKRRRGERSERAAELAERRARDAENDGFAIP